MLGLVKKKNSLPVKADTEMVRKRYPIIRFNNKVHGVQEQLDNFFFFFYRSQENRFNVVPQAKYLELLD